MDYNDLFAPLSIGLGVWFITWGMNRLYLIIKGMMS